ncbi:heterodisulfide reductase-related iron-sulfur binding cluster [Adlercreutzia sp. ZJ242]|uniref:heterodisulfide reductase-related iron-sulfur binding cluster n=1 Tax=Adlercreutzia sp. ZJ242 TaxID=2709409 RepID=UPI0013E9CF3E|nr:heterodisulfide reductase-related iron-sulfur binding cluster [Adlercreutzia sp. ZJ242]
MEDYTFADALTGNAVTFDYQTGEARLARRAEGEALPACETLFFPGCSFINYAMPLVAAVYDTLKAGGAVDGISLLCCGKILSYEPDGGEVRAGFEAQLRDHLAGSGITRIVAACPNCVTALRQALEGDARVEGIEIVALPQVLADLGYRIDRDTVAEQVKGDASAPVLLCTHDSCPDRATGEFADGLRALLPEGLYAEPEHARSRSLCCGSLPRAAGKLEAADKCARRNGEEALAVGADAIVTACMSCTFQLNMAQSSVQVVHFLELLYAWRVNWATVGAWMKLRFLFDDTMGVAEDEGSGRAFKGLGR